MSTIQHCRVDWCGRPVDIEYQWISASTPDRPVMVFLHEGLGSVSMWKDFPLTLCNALDWQGLVYSRPGYGHSTPRPEGERWQPDFLARQANEVLPALLDKLCLAPHRKQLWLFGHSDGGSIALIHAANFPGLVAGMIVIAPHVMVETVSIDSIQTARTAYEDGDLRARLARHHLDPDSAFWGWNDVWLSPAFRDWSIEHLLPNIQCPVLAVQGSADEYGSLEQIECIARHAPLARLHVMAKCGHSPQRERPDELIQTVQRFIAASPAQEG